jgi:hypothetical protein
MKLNAWLKSGIGYGWELLGSALEGARSAGEQIREEGAGGPLLGRSARTSLLSGIAVASVGLAAGYWLGKRRSAKKASMLGLLGAVIGFGGGLAWSTRRVTGGIARGALDNVNVARDARWLARHPVDYA